ncbi:MAG: hypothetical protein HC834_01485 [Rhodospirillales bacterium]|nr:hypothetical protein [Rhodospirillales bacterium]
MNAARLQIISEKPKYSSFEGLTGISRDPAFNVGMDAWTNLDQQTQYTDGEVSTTLAAYNFKSVSEFIEFIQTYGIEELEARKK